MVNPPNEAPPSCWGDDENFGLLLHFVRQGMIKHLEQALADQELGLNFTQYRVLKMLSGVPHLSASELARRLEHDAGALTRLLDKMQERGFLRRHSCPDDRRSVEISLTDAGRMLARPLRAISEQLTALAFSDLNDDEITTLMALLKRVRTTLEQ
ncbi:MAG: MarR family transcriptional regulator [Propionivibrio sp.]